MNEKHIPIRLQMYIPWNWEFGSALAKLRNWGEGGVEPPPPLDTPLEWKADKNHMLTNTRRF
jgi:hypothetical protein